MNKLGLLFLLLPSLASSKPAEVLCYLAKDPQINRGDSPVERGVDLEVVCAHVNRVVLSADVTKLDLTDGRQSLITQGRAYVENYKKKNPHNNFFTSRQLNTIHVDGLRERVARLALNATAIPKGNKVLIKGQVRLGLSGTRKKTLETTAGDIRKRKLGTGIEVAGAGFSDKGPVLVLGGSAAFAGFQTAPEGVVERNIFGTRGFILPDSVPDSARVVFHVLGAELVTVPVHIEVPVE
jgi:hypothetical protein